MYSMSLWVFVVSMFLARANLASLPSSVHTIVLLVAVALHAAECHSGKLKSNPSPIGTVPAQRGEMSQCCCCPYLVFLCILFCWPDVVRIYVTPQKTNYSPLRCRCHHCVVSVQICMTPMPVLVPLLFGCSDVKNILQLYRLSLVMIKQSSTLIVFSCLRKKKVSCVACSQSHFLV